MESTNVACLRSSSSLSAARRLAHKRQMSTDELLYISLFCSATLLPYVISAASAQPLSPSPAVLVRLFAKLRFPRLP